jgi:hypothetical protein
MAYTLKKPKPINSAYEDTEIVVQTDKGLYDWAKENQDTTGSDVNLLPAGQSEATVEMKPNMGSARSNEIMQFVAPTLIFQINSKSYFALGKSAVVPFVAGKTYTLSIESLNISYSNEKYYSTPGGWLEMIIEQLPPDKQLQIASGATPTYPLDAYIQRVKIPVNQLAGTAGGTMQAPATATFTVYDPPAGTSLAGSGLQIWFNPRNVLGLPSLTDVYFSKLPIALSPALIGKGYMMFEVVLYWGSGSRELFWLTVGEDTYIASCNQSASNKIIGFNNEEYAVPIPPNRLLHIVIRCKRTSSGLLYQFVINGQVFNNQTLAIQSSVMNNINGLLLSGNNTTNDTYVYSVRLYNTSWSTQYIVDNLWNNGRPLDTIMPQSLAVTNWGSNQRTQYGCCFDWQAWQGLINANATTKFLSRIGSENSYLKINNSVQGSYWPNSIQYGNAEYYYLNTEYGKNNILQSITASRVMLTQTDGPRPYRPSPADLLDSLSPTDSTLPTITALVKQADGSNKAVMLASVPDANGVVKYDMGWIFRSSFFHDREDDSGTDATYLAGSYTVSGIPGEESDNEERVFMRHISQYGRISDMQTEGAALLASPACLVKYEEFPLKVIVNANTTTGTAWFVTNDGGLAATGFSGVAGVDVADGISSFALMNYELLNAGYYEAQYTVRAGCIPPHPFYVRWVNALGGYDYWMFKALPEYEQEVDDIVNIQNSIDGQYRVWERVSATGRRRVHIGDGLLSPDEFAALQFIPRSPQVEWYDQTTGKWNVIAFDDTVTTAWNTRSGLGEVEYVFTLPPLRLQQL